MQKSINEYNVSQINSDKVICDTLKKIIDEQLPGSTSKIWHGHPVWFLSDNPIVGYSKLKDSVRLLFWSGQSFDEPGLHPEGSFKAAEIHYTSADQINMADLRNWLAKSKIIQWDYKNIVKRKGQLIKL